MKDIPVLFENNYCLIFNKPTGLAVQGGESVKISLDSILIRKYKPRPLLVHRLDKDTSGIILVAKSREAAKEFSTLFSGSSGLVKTYLGLCSGIPQKSEGTIKLDLNIKKKGQGIRSRKSTTHYRLIYTGELGGYACSLMELRLGTGRMHQIRRHLALKSHPIFGDDKYGNFLLNKELKKSIGLRNLMLHAYKLVIPPSPCFPLGLEINAPLPEHFSSILPVSSLTK